MAKEITEDRRVQRTRRALIDAFLELVVERSYDDIAVGDVIERAGVGRSTFYQHFSNKDDILSRSLAPGFETLAETLSDRRDPARLLFWVEAFWTNRKIGRVLLASSVRTHMVRALAAEIAPRLPDARTLIVPLPLASAQIAEAQLGLVNAWVSGRTASSIPDIAAALAATSRALADSLARR